MLETLLENMKPEAKQLYINRLRELKTKPNLIEIPINPEEAFYLGRQMSFEDGFFAAINLATILAEQLARDTVMAEKRTTIPTVH